MSSSSSKRNPRIGGYQVLNHLPSPERSMALLHRLATDPGILSTMAKHNFTIGTLREMEPLGNTTCNSRTLGLNTNRGQYIDLRLRTDLYDGYRDYKTIRETFCHELAHNVWGEHDGRFWELCRRIEKEVDAADYWKNGRALTNEVFYEPPPQPEAKKGPTGGTFKLGSGGLAGTTGGGGAAGTSMREILAKAAEERRARGAAA